PGTIPESPTLLPDAEVDAPRMRAGEDSKSDSKKQPAAAGDNQDWDFLAPAKGPGEIGWLGAYRVLKVLGAGGMGVVFQAEDPQLKRLVALKVIRPALAAGASAGKRFLREG